MFLGSHCCVLRQCALHSLLNITLTTTPSCRQVHKTDPSFLHDVLVATSPLALGDDFILEEVGVKYVYLYIEN
jgi:hypothetical protein